MSEFKREPRYVVFKLKDIEKYLTEGEKDSLMCIGDEIAYGRANDGKQPFNAVVVEQDWPEFEPTWAAIEARMTANAVGKPHRWNDDGERCLDCGDKDWMADKYCSAAPVVPPDPVLCNFYQVETFPDLVAALVHHIEKLQAKVPPFGNNWPGKVREG